MSADFLYLIEVIINGLMAGIMYSLVALGFVLIFKSSGVFNFSQGVMALFAAMTLVGVMTGQVPFAELLNALFDTDFHYFGWTVNSLIAILITVLVMILFAILVERLVLRHLVGQEPIILFMATIGLTYFLEGFGDLAWGSNIKPLDIGLPKGASTWIETNTAGWAAEGERFFGLFVDKLDIVAAFVAALLVASLALFSQFTKTGRALRAVADDHQAALSVGISLERIWVITWSIAGIIALIAGIMWGTKSGVQFSLSQIALKALPVLILGGFTSFPGAIVGGLIIGVGEKLFEYLIGPLIGGATENWFAYVLALIFLIFRPQGLFGEKIIERV